MSGDRSTSADFGSALPKIGTTIPGARARSVIDRLAVSESPALTARRARRAERTGAAQDPIVWSEALGSNVRDVDGNVFVDMTAGFGVASLGHRHPAIATAAKAQCDKLMHALGDVHPSDVKVALLQRLVSIAPWDARVILGLNGADAVDAAIKTATLATGRHRIVAFEGGYHGLTYGPLSVCGYKESFRAPFAPQLSPEVTLAPWPERELSLQAAFASLAQAVDEEVAAILVEPIQGRGGVRVPPDGFIEGLAELAHAKGALLIVDEILTGLGRCGQRFASGDAADILCVGKALGGGFPISACMGRAEVMRAWGDPSGEAIHTATFFGHPVSCAAALAALQIVGEEPFAMAAKAQGLTLLTKLRALLARSPRPFGVRGAGMMLAIEFGEPLFALKVAAGLLQRGYITLACGSDASALQLSPPVLIEEVLLDGFVSALREVLEELPKEELAHE